jgi:hypothetical protein
MFVIILHNRRRYSVPEIRAESHWLYCHVSTSYLMPLNSKGRDSIVGTDWTAMGVRNFCLLRNVQTDSLVHPASYSVGTVVIFRGKRPGRDVNHSPPSSVEFKTEWRFTSTLPVRFHRLNLKCNTTKLFCTFTIFLGVTYSRVKTDQGCG